VVWYNIGSSEYNARIENKAIRVSSENGETYIYENITDLLNADFNSKTIY
jgi:hypothetical protein